MIGASGFVFYSSALTAKIIEALMNNLLLLFWHEFYEFAQNFRMFSTPWSSTLLSLANLLPRTVLLQPPYPQSSRQNNNQQARLMAIRIISKAASFILMNANNHLFTHSFFMSRAELNPSRANCFYTFWFVTRAKKDFLTPRGAVKTET
jgi:hypothetical protein